MSLNFRDHAHDLRQIFIRASSLEQKLAALRARMHSEGKYFIGEEALALRHGGKMFHARKGWTK